MCSYLSKQRGRAYATTTDYLKDKNYCSISSLLRTGDLFNVDMCYRQIPDDLNPFDYETFDQCKTQGYAAACYEEMKKILGILKENGRWKLFLIY